MDKNSFIGLGLIATILIVWLSLSGPSKEQIARNKHIKDSVEQAMKAEELAQKVKEQKAKQAKLLEANNNMPLSDSLLSIQKQNQYKDFAIATSGTKELVTLENENIKVYISTKGAAVQKVELKNYHRYAQNENLVLFDSDSSYQNIEFDAYNTLRFNTDSFYFKPSSLTETVTGANSKTISLKLLTSNPSSYIEYVYTLKGNDYMLDFDINFVGMQSIITPKNNRITLNWVQALPSQEKHITKEREAATVYYNQTKEGVDYINPHTFEEKNLNEDNIKWLCFKQQFFNSTLIADSEFQKEGSVIVTSQNDKSIKYVKSIQAQLSIPFNHSSSEKFGMAYYFGPTQYSVLKNYDLDIEKIIPLGWSIFSYINKWMIIPLFDLFSGLNSGIVILIITLIIKTLLFPVAYKTYMSSAKMRVLKPEIEEINKKYEKNDNPMAKQQEQMSLYRRAGANPLSGCLPMLLQFPILIALFGFFPAAIELRQKPFLWADDLSTYDSIYDFGFNIWGYGDHISLFALLMFISTIIYTWMSQEMLQPQQTQQMPGMKYMMYLMPVIFLAVMNSYAAGLSWYYFLANIITFAQTWIMRKVIDDNKIREQLLANMKKPEKKSAFQQKLEEMAKQQQALQKGKK